MDDDDDGGAGALEVTTLPAHLQLKVDSVRHLFGIVSAIYNGRKDAFAMLTANYKGLRVSIENANKSMLATCLLKSELFSLFHVEPTRGDRTEIRFKVNISHLLDCLVIYGKDALPLTSLNLSYDEADGQLKMLLEESGVTTECELATQDFSSGDLDQDTDKDYDAAFKGEPIVGKLIVISRVLHDMIREVAELPGASTVTLTIANKRPYFQLHAMGSLGSVTVALDSKSDALVSLEAQGHFNFRYHLPQLEAGLRALANADQTLLRVNERGMLDLTHKVLTDSGASMMVHFMLYAEEEEEEQQQQQQPPPHPTQQQEQQPEDAGGGGAAPGGDPDEAYAEEEGDDGAGAAAAAAYDEYGAAAGGGAGDPAVDGGSRAAGGGGKRRRVGDAGGGGGGDSDDARVGRDATVAYDDGYGDYGDS